MKSKPWKWITSNFPFSFSKNSENDSLRTAKKRNVIEVTIRRKYNASPLTFCTVDELGREIKLPDRYHTIKQYFSLEGELLAEKDITMELIQEMARR